MRTLVINLDRSADRLAEVAAELARHGLSFERLAAVDGNAMATADIDAVRARGSRFQRPTSAEIGAFLSHRSAWREAAASGAGWTLVLEDDVRLADDIGDVLAAIETAPVEAGIVRLETTLRRVMLDVRRVPLGPRRSLRCMLSWHGGMAAYAISADCAAALVAATERISDPVDLLLFNPASPLFDLVRPHQVFPGAAMQRDMPERRAGESYISTVKRAGRPADGGAAGRMRALWRLFTRQAESVGRRIAALRPGRDYVFVPFSVDGRLTTTPG